ncbi:MAG: hypothetical protein GX613_11975 [Chloroflexi bacterium]|nr:hypothetical protein [Chloroflexota bacterium]
MTVIDPTHPRERDLMLAFAAFAVAVLLWQLDGLSALTYPLRLFVTMIHELGHGLAAILTGGSFLHFEVSRHGAGLAYTRGGSPFVILQAGYLGTALFGAGLLLLTHATRRPGPIAMVLGGLIALLSVLYSDLHFDHLAPLEIVVTGGVLLAAILLILTRDSGIGRAIGFGLAALGALMLVNFAGTDSSLRTLGVGVISGLALSLLGWRGRRDVVLVVLYFLAFLTGLQALTDAWALLKIVSAPRGLMPMNDAQLMADAYWGSATFWALVWVALDVVLFGGAIYLAFLRKRERRLTAGN